MCGVRLGRAPAHQLQDQRQAWDMQSDGTYIQRTPPPDARTGPQAIGTHQTFMDLTRQRNESVVVT